MKSRILVVDDELSMREFLSILIEGEGYEAATAANAEDALSQLENGCFDLVISDVHMPGLNGIELLARIKTMAPGAAVLMMTAFSAADQAVEAMKLGAYDYISKPFKVEEIKILIRNALEKTGLKRENEVLRETTRQRDTFCGIVGASPRMKEMFLLIRKVALSNSSVMIQGESGTGKELIARAIHICGPRGKKPFVAVNCGAIPESLMESELFGHKRGAFTGAVADRMGLFEQANGGTLMLDEIGELPLLMQTKLLRVLQEREFRSVGGSQTKKVDVRILTATNRDLQSEVKSGGFREDMFYRVNVVQIDVPPLRERIEDIPLLVAHFFQKYGMPGAKPEIISPAALKRLMNYHFPGNIRELENIVERSLVMDNSFIHEDNLPEFARMISSSAPDTEALIPPSGLELEKLLEDVEKKYLLKALEMSNGAKKKAGELLKMSFRQFRYRLSKFGLDPGEE